MSEERQVIPFNETVLVRIAPEAANLPIEAASELTKDFIFLNNVIHLMSQDTRQERTVDEDGNEVVHTSVNPHILEFLKVKRQYLNDIWKMMGGEVETEAQKEKMKLVGKVLYQQFKKNPNKLREMQENWKLSRSTG